MALKDIFSKNTDEQPKQPDPVPPPAIVKDRIRRGRERKDKGTARRKMCFKFFRDEQFCHVDEKNVLQVQATVTTVSGGGKPRHRVRQSLNLIKPIVEGKVSGSTKRVPSYEVNPTSPEKDGAAELAEKIAIYGYDKWRLRRATVKTVTHAVVADGGFAWPTWDASVGPFTMDPLTGKYVGLGEVRVRVYGRDQVLWEPGIDFDDSPWYGIEEAVPIEEAYTIDGYLGGKLTADATPADAKGSDPQNLVLLSHYFERPCPKYPQGRWLTMANNRIVSGVSQAQNGEGQIERPYPLTNPAGEPLDEPFLHSLTYTVDPANDEDMGLVRHLIDPQRSLNDAWSKSLEWKNRCLNPRILAPVGSIKTRPDDTPGGIDYYVPVGGQVPQWETVPPIPDSLFRVMDEARSAMQQIAGTQDLPPQIDSAKGVEAYLDSSDERWQSFIADLAEWHSRVMRHCLMLVQKYYTEQRTAEIGGMFAETFDFKGEDLLDQCNVRVFPSSIEPLTRDAIQNRIMFLVQNFPGQISLEEAMAAIKGGTAESLIESFELDTRRARKMIQKIKAGPEVIFNSPMRFDPVYGQVPSWMPRKQDNLAVHLHVFADYFKTDEFDRLDAPTQEAFNLYYDGCQKLQGERQLEMAQQQQQQAQGLGMSNASKGTLPPPMPNQPQPQAA